VPGRANEEIPARTAGSRYASGRAQYAPRKPSTQSRGTGTGLTWTRADVRSDQLHPNESGCQKTTALLLNFFKANEGAARWFLKPGEQPRLLPLPR